MTKKKDNAVKPKEGPIKIAKPKEPPSQLGSQQHTRPRNEMVRASREWQQIPSKNKSKK